MAKIRKLRFSWATEEELQSIEIGDKVRLSITDSNGYWRNSMKGTFQGFTPTGRIRVRAQGKTRVAIPDKVEIDE